VLALKRGWAVVMWWRVLLAFCLGWAFFGSLLMWWVDCLCITHLLLGPELSEVLILGNPGSFEELSGFLDSPSCLNQGIAHSIEPG